MEANLVTVRERLRTALASIFYKYHAKRLPEKQQQHLPPTYSLYEKYRKTYGVAPGDAFETEHGEVIVRSVRGAPTMGAVVTYYEVDADMEREVGLAAFMNMTERFK